MIDIGMIAWCEKVELRLRALEALKVADPPAADPPAPLLRFGGSSIPNAADMIPSAWATAAQAMGATPVECATYQPSGASPDRSASPC